MWLLLVVTLGLTLLEVWPGRLSPDGSYYQTRWWVRPYCLRPLQPRGTLAGGRWLSWPAVGFTALLLERAQPGAGVLFAGLASTRTNLLFPALTDAMAIMWLTLLIVTPFTITPWWCVIYGIYFGLLNEKAGVFAALATGNPWFLTSLAVTAVAWWRGKAPEKGKDPEWLLHPFREALKPAKIAELTDIRHMLLPWGAAAVGLLVTPWYLIVAAYAGCLMAQDRARVYQWIAPVMCLGAARIIPTEWLVPVLVVNLFNPWRRVV